MSFSPSNTHTHTHTHTPCICTLSFLPPSLFNFHPVTFSLLPFSFTFSLPYLISPFLFSSLSPLSLFSSLPLSSLSFSSLPLFLSPSLPLFLSSSLPLSLSLSFSLPLFLSFSLPLFLSLSDEDEEDLDEEEEEPEQEIQTVVYFWQGRDAGKMGWLHFTLGYGHDCVYAHVVCMCECSLLSLHTGRIQKKLEEAMDGPIDVILVKQVCISCSATMYYIVFAFPTL